MYSRNVSSRLAGKSSLQRESKGVEYYHQQHHEDLAMTTNSTTDLTTTLTLLYDLDDALMQALEAFVRKTFCQANLERFIANPATLFNVLDKVVYDDLKSFSYIHEWTIDYVGDNDEPLGCVLIHDDGIREATELFWLKDSKEVELKDVNGYWE